MNVPSPTPPLPSVSPPGGTNAVASVDDELLALPAPPQRSKWLAFAALTLSAAASLLLVWMLRLDVAYALTVTPPRDVGDLSRATAGGDITPEGGYVRARGRVTAARAIRYDRALTVGSFRLSPVWTEEGRDPVWVEVHLPEGVDTARFIPPEAFEGRLVRFGNAGPRYRGLAAAVSRETGAKIETTTWLLVDEGKPETMRWAPAIAFLMVAFAGWNLATLARLARKVRSS